MKLWCDIAVAVARAEVASDITSPSAWANKALEGFDEAFPKPEPVTVNDLKGIANEPEKESEEVMKTAGDWFNKCLPPDIAKKAIANTKAENPSYLEQAAKSLYWALSDGFLWINSPEGVDYWITVAKKYCWR